jgi:hypothetical protein
MDQFLDGWSLFGVLNQQLIDKDLELSGVALM